MTIAIACEVLARRIVHLSPPDRIRVVMSTRFRHLESDGDESDMSSALELAIDTNWYALTVTMTCRTYANDSVP